MTRTQRRVLIVTSAFPPTVLADMQRARMLAYDLPSAGWEVEILTAGPEFQRKIWIEPDATSISPGSTPIHEVRPFASGFFRALRLRSVGWRALWPIYQLGCRLLRERNFDLVYITTTQFILFCLGPLWQARLRTPYVLDFHDPWVRDENPYRTTRHRIKLTLSTWLAKPLEKFVVGNAAGVVSVSPNYIDSLRRRYPDACSLRNERSTVIPFAATEHDSLPFRPTDNSSGVERTMIYIGAGGSIMAKSFKRILELLTLVRDKRLVESVRIYLYGTDGWWKEGQSKYLEDIAEAAGVTAIVIERPTRIPYSESLKKIHAADGLFVLGVDDSAYMPSKLFTYSLTGKPLLVCLHKDSQAKNHFERTPEIGTLIQFGDESAQARERDLALLESFLANVYGRVTFDRTETLTPYLSAAAAQQHAELFDRCLLRNSSH